MASEIPELISSAAEASGVSPEEIISAIRLTLDLVSAKPSAEERRAIYKQWLEPVSGPLGVMLNMPIETVHLALVACVQRMDER